MLDPLYAYDSLTLYGTAPHQLGCQIYSRVAVNNGRLGPASERPATGCCLPLAARCDSLRCVLL